MDKERATERMKKIYSLALNGIDGEQEQAQKILDKLLDKYSLSLEEINEEKTECFDIKYRGAEQESLLSQIIYKVTDNKNCFGDYFNNYTKRKDRTKLWVNCTAVQKIEIEFLFDFYKTLWEKEKKAFFRAFIEKHKIFGNADTGEKKSLSREEIMKMYAMMNSMDDAEPIKRIEGSTL